MHPSIKVALIVAMSHATRFAAEWAYWHNCAGFVTSVFASGSQTCKALRYVSESSTTNIMTIAGTYALKTIGA
jgi:hypothetical protein